MVGPHVLTDRLDHRVVGLADGDVSTLARDLLGHDSSFVVSGTWGYVGAALANVKVQLCGRLAVTVDGERVESQLPGRQGRLLVAYLALHRLRPVDRAELIEALWPDGRDAGLAPLLSKVRRIVPVDGLRIAAEDAWVDVEAAADAVHRAESALAQDDPHRSWGPSQVALFISGRRASNFLAVQGIIETTTIFRGSRLYFWA